MNAKQWYQRSREINTSRLDCELDRRPARPGRGGRRRRKRNSEREMQGDEARLLLGFPPNSRPTTSQVKAAYKKKVWESHPDLFPPHEKLRAESNFKLISEAYTSLLSNSGARGPGTGSGSATCSRVYRYGAPKVHGKRNHALISIPFLFIMFGTMGLGGFHATRAYRKNREEYPSHNPFLP